jgi:alkylation response protein AidB-like acyl-CoA dehydrogenase
MSELPLSARDIEFVLYELLEVERLCERPRYAEHGRESFDAMLETARRIAEERFLPYHRKADQEGVKIVEGKVTPIPETKAAYDAAAEAGFLAAHHDEAVGGLQLPWVVTQAAFAHFKAGSVQLFSYHFLTIAAANMLAAFGSEEQKALYLPRMLDGRFSGTMALTEPHAGSGLADLSTKATPQGDGSYRIKGAKIFTSCAEHELTQNIVHMVLARIDGAPKGTKGISLFLVPRYRLDGNGEPGEPNDVVMTGMLEKMGWHGNTSSPVNFGENDGCLGWLIGEPNRGLFYMFSMMNEARIGIGLGGATLACCGYSASLAYARERPQGRLPSNKDPDSLPVAIVDHADIKRMLLAQKAYAEGAMALVLYAASLVDEQKTAPDAAARARAGQLLDVLTPIVKSYPAEYGTLANSHAVQVLGGYGYTRDFPVEQYFRDNRLNAIHEGTTGIQALDLLGRKVGMEDGAAFAALTGEIEGTIEEARGHNALGAMAGELADALETVKETTAALLAAKDGGKIDLALANATLYLDTLGQVVIAWTWLRQAVVATARSGEASAEDTEFYAGKLQACRYIFRWELPKIAQQCALLASLDATTLEMRDEWF